MVKVFLLRNSWRRLEKMKVNPGLVLSEADDDDEIFGPYKKQQMLLIGANYK